MIETDNTSRRNNKYAHLYVVCMAYIEISHFHVITQCESIDFNFSDG